MLSGTPKSKEIRKYYIKMENIMHQYTENTDESSDVGDELRQRIGRIVDGASKCEPDHNLKTWLAKVGQQFPELFMV
jgi:hypothetical protein